MLYENEKKICLNTTPVSTIERGFKVICCEEHAYQIVKERNEKKSNKLSKSKQEINGNN